MAGFVGSSLGMLQELVEWSADIIHKLLLRCGEVALRHYASPERTLKGDLSIVTQADRAIEALIAEVADRPEQGSFLLGEETIFSKSEDYLQSALKGRTLVVDPIDGTAPYAYQIPLWGSSIGLMENGVLTEGAIYFPVTGEIFISEGESILFSDETRPDAPGKLARLTPVKAWWNDHGLIAVTQGLAKKGRLNFSNPVHTLACAVLPMSYLLRGRYLAYVGSLKLWDLGGGIPLLLKAGFDMRLLTGEKMDGSVSEKFFHLDPGSQNRWKTRTPLVFSPSEESFRKVTAAVVW